VVPVVYGYPDAVVLLPPGASAWPEGRRRALLVHELAHVGRRDFLSQTLAHVARLLYWPHPLVWWLVRRLRAEAERACDDIVLSAGTAASDYASMLLDAARDLRRARRPLAMLAVVERSRLEERLLALLEPAARRGRVGRRSLLLGTSAGLALAVAAATLQPARRGRGQREAGAGRIGAPPRGDVTLRG
jgi:beta-lactamase regulating signal transducer with metallopeptidase domain